MITLANLKADEAQLQAQIVAANAALAYNQQLQAFLKTCQETETAAASGNGMSEPDQPIPSA